jgi:hypothetical protein
MLPLVLLLVLAPRPAADSVQALKPEHRVVEQPEAPVQVTGYRTEYLKRTAEAPEGFRHDLEYRSRTDQRIVAVQFGFVSFDVWNEFLERHAALASDALDANDRKRSSWFTATSSGVAFLTGVVYVERVRFASGEIWSADLASVVKAMQTVQQGFTAEQLTKKRDR